MNESDSRTEFGTLREKAGLSIFEVAQLIGRSDRTVRRYESLNSSATIPPVLVLETLRRIVRERSAFVEESPSFRFIDHFAGIGGLRIPFEELGGKCVFSSEWDRFARETYAANFPEIEDHVFAGDIRPFSKEPQNIPHHDLVLAGFPCQPFSIAGVSKKNSLGKPHGFLCDTQGTLFYDLAEMIRFHNPLAFLLENVRNLQWHDGGKTFATIIHVLREELGYEVHSRVISSHYWVPQRRERIFIVGFRHATAFSFDDIEFPVEPRPTLGDILEPNVPEKYTLSPHLWDYLKRYRRKHRKAGNGFGYSLFGRNDVSRTLSARYHKDGSEILLNQRGRPRRLTPRECSRLMGFDDFQGSSFVIPVSDTQAYKQFGNAVVIPVVRAIARLMEPHIINTIVSENQTLSQSSSQTATVDG